MRLLLRTSEHDMLIGVCAKEIESWAEQPGCYSTRPEKARISGFLLCRIRRRRRDSVALMEEAKRKNVYPTPFRLVKQGVSLAQKHFGASPTPVRDPAGNEFLAESISRSNFAGSHRCNVPRGR
jgi:hypothetical protein